MLLLCCTPSAQRAKVDASLLQPRRRGVHTLWFVRIHYYRQAMSLSGINVIKSSLDIYIVNQPQRCTSCVVGKLIAHLVQDIKKTS